MRSASLVLVIPFVLLRFDPAETALWFLLMLVFGLVPALELGASHTFVRLISFAMGGAKVSQLEDFETLRQPDGTKPNIGALNEITVTMRRFYFGLAAFAIVFLATAGSAAMIRTISQLVEPTTGWLAWIVTLVGTSAAVYSKAFISYLLGINQIALMRRWEVFATLGQLFTVLVALAFGADVLLLVIVTHSWAVFLVVRNFFLCRRFGEFGFDQQIRQAGDGAVARIAKAKIWRSGVGMLVTFGLIRLTGLLQAQFAVGLDLTIYLLGLRLIHAVSLVSTAPFYNKLPKLAQLVTGHRIHDLLHLAERGLRISYWSFAAAFFVVAFGGEYLLPLIGKSAEAFDPRLWRWLGMAFFLERVSFQYLHVYSLTNRIHWHVVNGVWGGIYVVGVALLLKPLGVIAFPVAMILAYLLFHLPINVFLAYRTFDIPFPKFELRTSVGPALLILIYFLAPLISN